MELRRLAPPTQWSASLFKTARPGPFYAGLMQPLLVLGSVFALLLIPFGWWDALRVALAVMFLVTASAHWGRRRPDLIRMVQPAVPRPELMVTLTGIFEIMGALGLLVAPVAPFAALGLALLLIGVFPANVRAARQRLTIGGRPTTPLALRAAIQIVFLVATAAVASGRPPGL
jgi:uncharacterized membrane protein